MSNICTPGSRRINFYANFDGRRELVEISEPSGSIGGIDLMIGNYYRGQIVKGSDGVWRGFFNGPVDEFDSADVTELARLIETELYQQGATR